MNLEIFNFNESEEIRIFIDENQEIWFNANDTFKILGINSKGGRSDALAGLDEDERSSFKTNTNGGEQNMEFVSESGLYALIMRSRKPIAKPFQKWVTKEVLPSIRKTGKYELSEVKDSNSEDNLDLDKYIQNNRKLIELVHLITSENAMTLHYLNNLSQYFGFESPTEMLKIDLQNFYFIPTELGKFLNKSAVEINKILESKGFQIKVNGVWQLTDFGKNYAIQLDNKFSTIKWKLETLI